jgi:hypothetical protein
VKGWQLNEREVSRFKFVAADQSVAVTHWGDSIQDAGTIAVAIFRENLPEIYVHPFNSRGGTRSMGKGLGTAEGEREHAPVRTVEFEPKAIADNAFVIRYDTWARLIARGVVRPRSEPGSNDFGRFGCDGRFTGLDCPQRH